MKRVKLNWIITDAVILIAFTFLLQSCAGSGSLGSSGNTRTYQTDYNTMVKTVEQAIKGLDLVVTNANETTDPRRVTITYARLESSGTETVQRHKGEVRVTRMDDAKTEVTVENPDYHFALSDRDRINYRRLIFNRIEDILN